MQELMEYIYIHFFQEFELVANEMVCMETPKIFKGSQLNLTECSMACQHIAFMFIYKRNCKPPHCDCNCEKGAQSNGTCTQTKNTGYDLYRYKVKGSSLKTTVTTDGICKCDKSISQ